MFLAKRVHTDKKLTNGGFVGNYKCCHLELASALAPIAYAEI